MMNLIDEQDRFLSRCAQAIRGGGKHSAHFGDIAFHTADPNKFCVCHLGDDAGQRRLSTAWWPIENYRWQAISFNRAAQQFARRKDVFLADKFLERARPHPRGERRGGVCSFKLCRFLEWSLNRRGSAGLLAEAILAE